MEKINFVWDIHYKCNFRCPYCWFDGKWDEMGKHNRYIPVKDLIKIWERIHSKYGECHIMITGGEPSLYPDFIEFIEKLSLLHTVKITSQLSGDYFTFAEKINPKRVILDMNFHPIDARLEPFIEKVLALKNKGFTGGVCYLAYPPQMDKIEFYRQQFEKNKISFALAAFWGEYKGKKYPESYTEEERNFMKPFMGDMNRIQHHLEGKKTKGKLCRAGHIYASIKADGTVTRCGPLSHKPIGNIFDDNFEMHIKPMPCEAEICPNDEYIWLVND
jgi:MoaA/NifB/PqqE/SkfB family radical SAM enzyme